MFYFQLWNDVSKLNDSRKGTEGPNRTGLFWVFYILYYSGRLGVYFGFHTHEGATNKGFVDN